MVNTAWGRCPMQVLQTWGSKDLPAENKAGWDGGLGFLDQIQFPIIWPWFVMLILWASVVSLFCQLPRRKGGKAIAQCSWATLQCPKSLLPDHFCLLCLGGAEELLCFCICQGDNAFKEQLGKLLATKQTPRCSAAVWKFLVQNCMMICFFQDFFFNEDGDRLTASGQCPVWNWHILPEIL